MLVAVCKLCLQNFPLFTYMGWFLLMYSALYEKPLLTGPIMIRIFKFSGSKVRAYEEIITGIIIGNIRKRSFSVRTVIRSVFVMNFTL